MTWYVYHYHAMCQLTPSAVTHLDGVLNLEAKIKCHEGIRAAKATIAEGYCAPEKLTLCSLTLLHVEEEEDTKPCGTLTVSSTTSTTTVDVEWSDPQPHTLPNGKYPLFIGERNADH